MDNIYVNQPFLPERDAYHAYLDGIWDNHLLTNHGPLSIQLKKQLENFLGIEQMTLVSNGTLALQIAIKALDLKQEVITTPFSHISTTSALIWQGIQPVFVDINPNTLNIDPDHIEKSITHNTRGILVPHIFGNPCDVYRIQEIADQYQLKILYDCAHAFNVQLDGRALCEFGDASIFSFHATKIFHTVEGGAIIANHKAISHRAEYMASFGHNGQEDFFGVGINGKLDELRAAMGLCLLPHLLNHIEKRKNLVEIYCSLLGNAEQIRIMIPLASNVSWNYSYFPVIFEEEELMQKIKHALEQEKIYPRRYFYPVLSRLSYLDLHVMPCPVAEDIAKRILCLPLYTNLDECSVIKISHIVLETVKNFTRK